MDHRLWMFDRLWRTLAISIRFHMLDYVSVTYEAEGSKATALFGIVSSTGVHWVVTSEGRLRVDLSGVAVQSVTTIA